MNFQNEYPVSQFVGFLICKRILKKNMAHAVLLMIIFGSAFSLNAFGITRIGNTKFGSEDLKFVAEIRYPFVFLNSQANESATLISQDSSVFRDGEILQVKSLQMLSPETQELSRLEFVKLFKLNHKGVSWKKVSVSDSCVEGFVYKSGTKSIGVSSWGNGVGIVFSGSGEDFVYDAIYRMIQSVDILPGGCLWQ
jgi:hypothetical protein